MILRYVLNIITQIQYLERAWKGLPSHPIKGVRKTTTPETIAISNRQKHNDRSSIRIKEVGQYNLTSSWMR